MENKVTIVADRNGNIICPSLNNPDYGYIRVEQFATQINDQGWLKNVKRYALIKGKMKDLIECGYKENQQIHGKIVVRESLTPFNSESPDKDLKIAGNTGVICRLDDEPIYRQTFFTTNLNSNDEFIIHNNSEEIKEVLSTIRETTAESILKSLKVETTL
jgi:hypothetical protein